MVGLHDPDSDGPDSVVPDLTVQILTWKLEPVRSFTVLLSETIVTVSYTHLTLPTNREV